MATSMAELASFRRKYMCPEECSLKLLISPTTATDLRERLGQGALDSKDQRRHGQRGSAPMVIGGGVWGGGLAHVRPVPRRPGLGGIEEWQLTRVHSAGHCNRLPDRLHTLARSFCFGDAIYFFLLLSGRLPDFGEVVCSSSRPTGSTNHDRDAADENLWELAVAAPPSGKLCLAPGGDPGLFCGGAGSPDRLSVPGRGGVLRGGVCAPVRRTLLGGKLARRSDASATPF